ncbi:MAG: hypothetical protein AAB464_01620 [Patescibacteria group bacterium]
MFIVYLFNRFFYRLKEFFRHWYVKSFFIYTDFVVSFLERLDRVFAFKITLRFLFQPLYGDYSVLGYILGFIFRISRLAVGGLVHLAVIAIAVVLYLIWLATPIYIVYRILWTQ